jgi:hypothetical protein
MRLLEILKNSNYESTLREYSTDEAPRLAIQGLL